MNNTNNNKKKTKFDDSENNINYGTFIIGFSKCGETYIMKTILHQKQEPIFKITKIIKSISQHQSSNIR